LNPKRKGTLENDHAKSACTLEKGRHSDARHDPDEMKNRDTLGFSTVQFCAMFRTRLGVSIDPSVALHIVYQVCRSKCIIQNILSL
jgi:hypothetical protein